MFDSCSTDTLCVAAGAVALGAIYMSRRDHMYPYAPTECSARKAEVGDEVSARAAAVSDEAQDKPYDEDLWGFTEEAAEAMKAARPPTAETSQAVRNARIAVSAAIETNFTKGIGATTLVGGRPFAEGPAKPKVTGGCYFNLSEAYADELQKQTSQDDVQE